MSSLHMTSYDIIWHHMTSHEMTWRDMTWHDMTWRYTIDIIYQYISHIKDNIKSTCFLKALSSWAVQTYVENSWWVVPGTAARRKTPTTACGGKGHPRKKGFQQPWLPKCTGYKTYQTIPNLRQNTLICSREARSRQASADQDPEVWDFDLWSQIIRVGRVGFRWLKLLCSTRARQGLYPVLNAGAPPISAIQVDDLVASLEGERKEVLLVTRLWSNPAMWRWQVARLREKLSEAEQTSPGTNEMRRCDGRK